MRILMIAPEPFFEPRGTPFSEFHRIRALTALGPSGRSRHLSVRRGRHDARASGLSRDAAAVCPSRQDRAVARQASARRFAHVHRHPARCSAARYDAIHSHEEGGLIGVVLAALSRMPHLYDMHSSLPQQLTNFAFSRSPIIRSVFTAIERLMIRRSRVVIVICPALEETVRGDRAGRRDRADRERAGFGRGARDAGAGPRGARAVRVSARDAGRALHRHVRGVPGARPAVRGDGRRQDGAPGRAAAAGRRQARSGRPAPSPTRPPRGLPTSRSSPASGRLREIPAYLLACDVLVSPRSRGTNTPLKIYQYLRSGKPIVATRLLTHTQVLSDETAILTGASPQEFADGILEAIADRNGRPAGRTCGARAGRDEVQLRGVSRSDAPGLRCADAGRVRSRR